MKAYLLDTNLFIYVAAENPMVCSALADLDVERFYVSVISRLEFLVGMKDERHVDWYLNDCINLPVTQGITDIAAELFRKYKFLKFKDSIIVATAMQKNLTLVTADKALSKIEELQVQIVQSS